MPSPFPGMNPYLENSEFWSAVHNRLIVAIADDLVEHLSDRYRVEIEKRTYFSNDDENVLVGIADVAVVTRKGVEPSGATTAISVQPEKVVVPIAQEVNERYLEIREVATGTVVTVIEILSPKNKRAGEGRIAYERKRNQVLASMTHLVEIDLLRGGRPFPIASRNHGDYRILICRGDHRPTGDLFAFDLRQPIPVIPVPLMPSEAEPLLDLQKLLHQIYDRGRYRLAINYTQPLQPVLSEEEKQWVEDQLERR
ncbi:MAG: DUF4058 family protein [Plectolyngbya sp. WJT66-NPBG17]|jgi:hypothetical protein|nr:DUF4058 family protein [Plectolyngbya sp. WJT66-NPBG17]MBW4525234.1 DUF4058 family protein [Phormidium tanganyikae FI6-MK23]